MRVNANEMPKATHDPSVTGQTSRDDIRTPHITRIAATLLTPPLASLLLGSFLVATVSHTTASAQQDPTAAARAQLVETIRHTGALNDDRVLQVIGNTPRHQFIPRAERERAYFDMGVPIGHQQTISSPFIVAYMTQSLDPQPTDRVLEVGTGSGYQAAILSPLVADVYSIEIIGPLGQRAARTLKRLGYQNVHTRIGDGYQGWPEHAPFDKIIVTCSPHDVPQPLIDQLRDGGRLIVPVGERYQQTLYLFEKQNGKLEPTALRPTLFVPMTGEAESSRPDTSTAWQGLVNGDFEATTDETTEFVPGWYYQRQAELVEEDDADGTADRKRAGEGKRFVRFTNRDVGRSAHLMQGMALNGREISSLRLSGSVRTRDVVPGRAPDMVPSIVLTLYDGQRRELAHRWLGPWRGTMDWQRFEEVVRVPTATREAIVRIGLFGATGVCDVDDVALTHAPAQ